LDIQETPEPLREQAIFKQQTTATPKVNIGGVEFKPRERRTRVRAPLDAPALADSATGDKNTAGGPSVRRLEFDPDEGVNFKPRERRTRKPVLLDIQETPERLRERPSSNNKLPPHPELISRGHDDARWATLLSGLLVAKADCKASRARFGPLAWSRTT